MRPHHRTTAIVLALVAVVFGVFFRTLESGFLRWDDDINVFENPHVQGLTAENLRWMFTDFEQAIRYKPLSWLAWAVVHEVFGLNPFGYHLANVLLHCANTVLVFLLIRRLLTLSSSLAPTGEEGWGEGQPRTPAQEYYPAPPYIFFPAVHPPSTSSVVPVMKLASGEARNRIVRAISKIGRAHV